MRSEDFIGRCVRGEQIKERCVASIYFDGETIYSYGRHYPLLIKIGSSWILNDRGYSSTTGKHINWARGYNDGVVSIPNDGVVRGKPSIDQIRKYILEEMEEITKELKTLRKNAFRKKERLESRFNDLDKTFDLIKTAL